MDEKGQQCINVEQHQKTAASEIRQFEEGQRTDNYSSPTVL